MKQCNSVIKTANSQIKYSAKRFVVTTHSSMESYLHCQLLQNPQLNNVKPTQL